MEVIHTTSKGKMLDTMGKFYIYKEIQKTQIDNQINDKCTVKPNVVLETLILEDTDRAHQFFRTHLSHTQCTQANCPANLNRKYIHIPIINFITRLLRSTPLRYRLEGRGFDSRLCHWNFSLTILPAALWPWG